VATRPARPVAPDACRPLSTSSSARSRASAAGADVLRRPPPGVVVLIYHRVGGGSGTAVDLAPELFDEQMAVLAEGRSVVTLEAALTDLAVPPTVPRNGRWSSPSTTGPPTSSTWRCPSSSGHRLPPRSTPPPPSSTRAVRSPTMGTPVSWSALRDACATGTRGHRLPHPLAPAPRPPADRAGARRARPLDRAHRRAARPGAARLRVPEGAARLPAAEEAVRARFRSAAVAGTHANRYGATDPHRLARSPVRSATA
jgi:hypothetical protein